MFLTNARLVEEPSNLQNFQISFQNYQNCKICSSAQVLRCSIANKCNFYLCSTSPAGQMAPIWFLPNWSKPPPWDLHFCILQFCCFCCSCTGTRAACGSFLSNIRKVWGAATSPLFVAGNSLCLPKPANPAQEETRFFHQLNRVYRLDWARGVKHWDVGGRDINAAILCEASWSAGWQQSVSICPPPQGGRPHSLTLL